MTLTSPEALLRLPPAGGPLAGRGRELGRLRAAWARAVAGRGGMVLVGGEAGVGKTRLAAELAADVDSAGGLVLVGRCPAGGADPYHPLVEALGPVEPVPGRVNREAVFATLADTLVRRSQRAPVLVLLDDLHAADRSTVLAVGHLAGAAAGAAVLIVGTYRDVAVDRSSPLADLLEHPGVEHVTLEGLGAADLGEIYDDPDLARLLWRRSGGNPVMVDELVRLAALDEPVPPAFDELVARRLDRLDAPARRVLGTAAVVGTEFGVAVVASAAKLSTDRAGAALDRAAAAGFVVAEAGVTDSRRFLHDMVREAVEHRIDPAERVRLHRRVARALESSRRSGPQASPALLAWHFRAGSPVGASNAVLRHAAAAGDRAMDVLAWEAAAEHYGHALGAAPNSPAAIRADLLLALGEAQRLAGETARARQAFLEAAAEARASGDGTRLARAALALGQVAAVWGADPILESLAAEARKLLGPEHRPSGRTPPLPASAPAPVATLASKAFFASEQLYDVLDGVTAQPTSTPAPTPAPAPAVAALTSIAAASGRPGSTTRADSTRGDRAAGALLRARHAALAGPEHAAARLATADDMAALAARTGDHDLAALAHGRRLVDLLELGRLDDAAAAQAAHAGVPGRLGLPAHSRDVALWSAMRALVEGRAAEAGVAADDALRLGAEAGDTDASASFLIQRWALILEWGTVDELLAVADECDSVAGAAAGALQAWRPMAALALTRAGEDELAAQQLHRVTGRGLGPLTRDPSRLHPLTCLAEVAWAVGDASAAAALGPMLEPFAGSFVVVGRGLVWRGSVARACALAAAATGRWDDAEHHIEAALAAHRRAGALPLVARTRLEQARILVGRGRRGDRRRAADARRTSTELAGRLGMAHLGADAA